MDSSCNKMINILVHASLICPTMICLSSVYLHVLSHSAVQAVSKKQHNIFSYQTSKKEPFKFRPRPIFFTSLFERLLNKLAQLKKKTMIYLYVHVLDILVTYCHISKLFLKEKKNRYIMIKYGTMSVIAAWWLLNQHSHVLISKCPLRAARRGNSVVRPVTRLIRGIYISIIFYDE